jgi:hypothetical protein
MADITVRIQDVSGSKNCEVQAPDNVKIDRLMVLLAEKLSLPINSPDGQLMSYKLHHRRSGKQLMDHDTFASAGVATGDEIRLQPEITAG